MDRNVGRALFVRESFERWLKLINIKQNLNEWRLIHTFIKKQMSKITKREFCKPEKLKCHHKRKINNNLIYAFFVDSLVFQQIMLVNYKFHVAKHTEDIKGDKK